MAKVLITGVSGYVGSWCMEMALREGYEVVGTVRDPDAAKCAFLRDAMAGKPGKIHRNAQSKLKLVKVDLLSGVEAWSKVFAENPGIKYVLHTASPFFATAPKDPNDFIRPAVEGTTSVLSAAKAAGVKRVVVTSSCAAVMEPVVDGKTYTAEDWSDPAHQPTYGKSKTMAEKAAWDTLKGSAVELCTVNPMFVVGPTLYADKSLISTFESGSVILKCLTGQMPFMPNMCMGIVDVRDVATAHMKALTNGNAPGKRFICNNSPSGKTFLQILTKFCKAIDKKGPSKVPTCCFGCVTLILPEAKILKPSLDKMYNVDPSQTTKVLGFEFISEDATIQDMVQDYVDIGAIPAPTRK